MFNKNTLHSLYNTSKLSSNPRNEDNLISELNMFSKDIKNISGIDMSLSPFVQNFLEYGKLRRDTAKKSSSQKEITSNAKNIKDNCFTVPKII